MATEVRLEGVYQSRLMVWVGELGILRLIARRGHHQTLHPHYCCRPLTLLQDPRGSANENDKRGGGIYACSSVLIDPKIIYRVMFWSFIQSVSASSIQMGSVCAHATLLDGGRKKDIDFIHIVARDHGAFTQLVIYRLSFACGGSRASSTSASVSVACNRARLIFSRLAMAAMSVLRSSSSSSFCRQMFSGRSSKRGEGRERKMMICFATRRGLDI